MTEYNPKKIEKKWQRIWEKNKSFESKSDRENKKYKAIFERENGSRFTTHFGAKQNGKPMDDYTITKDKEQRARYRNRHRKDLESNECNHCTMKILKKFKINTGQC